MKYSFLSVAILFVLNNVLSNDSKAIPVFFYNYCLCDISFFMHLLSICVFAFQLYVSLEYSK